MTYDHILSWDIVIWQNYCLFLGLNAALQSGNFQNLPDCSSWSNTCLYWPVSHCTHGPISQVGKSLLTAVCSCASCQNVGATRTPKRSCSNICVTGRSMGNDTIHDLGRFLTINPMFNSVRHVSAWCDVTSGGKVSQTFRDVERAFTWFRQHMNAEWKSEDCVSSSLHLRVRAQAQMPDLDCTPPLPG